jgi:hypothetical protein
MSAMLWRVLIAVVVVLVVFALIPPVLRIFGFPANADLLLVFRIVVAGLALLYVLKGPPVNIG